MAAAVQFDVRILTSLHMHP